MALRHIEQALLNSSEFADSSAGNSQAEVIELVERSDTTNAEIDAFVLESISLAS